jgi:hypothetical protein
LWDITQHLVKLVKHYTTLDGIGKPLHNTWWKWWNITQPLVELVRHYTTLSQIGETLHNIWWNWWNILIINYHIQKHDINCFKG